MQVFLIAALTADGFIARQADDRSFTWTSAEDKQFYLNKIKEAGAVVMGSKTFKTLIKYPKGLTMAVYTRDPESFINPKPDVIKAFGTNLQPRELLEKLDKQGHSQIAIAGGSSIYTQFLQAGVVDKLYLTVEPILFGKGLHLFDSSLSDQKLELIEVHRLSPQTIVLEYQVFRHKI